MKHFSRLLIYSVAASGFVLITYSWRERSREIGLRSSCQSNIRQLGLGFWQYAQDYDNRFPLIASNSKAKVDVSGDKYGQLNGAPSFGWADAIQYRVKATGILHCQKENTWSSMETAYTQPLATDYWMNGNLSGLRVNKITYPSRTFLHGDGDGRDADSTARYNKVGPPTKSYDDTQPVWTMRHMGGANYSFVDGHVKWLKPDGISAKAGAAYTFSPK